MSPVDWRRAPKWAKWSAQDRDGRRYWYSKKPIKADKSEGKFWVLARGGRLQVDLIDDWEQSLEDRPAEYAEGAGR